MLEGREFVGIEKEAGYCEIARRRMAHAGDAGPLFPGLEVDLVEAEKG